MDLDDANLFAEERKLRVVQLIEEHGKATVTELCSRFGVSSATVRNDLRDLQEAGMLARTHGGAIRKGKTGFELFTKDREIRNLAAKQAIAQAAIDMIEDGDRIILDTGTTTLQLARLVGLRNNLTVVTNDLEIARTLEDIGSVEIVVLGGIVRRGFHCTITVDDRDGMGLLADKAFMGANSFSLERGAMTPDIRQARMKKAMIAMSNKIILLCDGAKMGKASFAQFAGPGEIDTLVTDHIDRSLQDALEEQGVEIVVAQAQS